MDMVDYGYIGSYVVCMLFGAMRPGNTLQKRH